MTAKDYLSQAFLLDHRIDSKIEQVASLNALATKCTSTLTGMPHSPNHGQATMANAIEKIVCLQSEINEDIETLVDLKRELVRVIKSVPDNECQLLLEKRYLCYQKWEQIAVSLRFSLQHTHRIHDRALQEIEKSVRLLER